MNMPVHDVNAHFVRGFEIKQFSSGIDGGAYTEEHGD
jgi:hypothetical protein